MPVKYLIHTKPAPPRFPPVGKLGIVDWREDCSNCHNCVKRSCVYGLFRSEADRLSREVGYLDYLYQCKGCLNCVQNCTKGILTRVVNPEYRRLGDSFYTPDVVSSTWFQAETGRIPVSGAGYGGPFSGPGFDSMWTDMSEIVRPTRDGIHGREYINTSVDIGRKLGHLTFREGGLDVSPPPLIESPLPLIFDIIPGHFRYKPVVESILRAAARVGLRSVLELSGGNGSLGGDPIIPLMDGGEGEMEGVSGAPLVLLRDGRDILSVQGKLKERNPRQIVAIRIPATPEATGRILDLVRNGAEVIHLAFDLQGREEAPGKPRHMRDVLREVHGALLRDQTRDLVTLVASGGIAMAEHMAKAIICGADLVAVDIPLLLALECTLCGECERGSPCPQALDRIDPAYGSSRILNLVGAWHQQLIEMLGAMGIREVRRLRGETGRCMFFEDLEREVFGRLFGNRGKGEAE